LGSRLRREKRLSNLGDKTELVKQVLPQY
jgi:hypothetical protein